MTRTRRRRGIVWEVPGVSLGDLLEVELTELEVEVEVEVGKGLVELERRRGRMRGMGLLLVVRKVSEEKGLLLIFEEV